MKFAATQNLPSFEMREREINVKECDNTNGRIFFKCRSTRYFIDAKICDLMHTLSPLSLSYNEEKKRKDLINECIDISFMLLSMVFNFQTRSKYSKMPFQLAFCCFKFSLFLL